MKRKLPIALPMFSLLLSAAAGAAALPAETADELRAASRQLDEAALLRNVATDRIEVQHLLAARDLLREAEPSLDGKLREQAQVLEYEIGRDVHATDEPQPPQLFTLVPSHAMAPVDRNVLGELAQHGAALARQTDGAGSNGPAAGA